MDTKFYWMDDADQFSVKAKLESGRKKYADYDWVRFRDDVYDSTEDAFKSLASMLTSVSFFTPGKIIYCYGIPFKKNAGEYHQRLSKEIRRAANKVCFIIISKPDRVSSLYKTAKEIGKVEEPFELNKTNAVDWITVQANHLGLKIEKHACMMLADITDFNPGRIQNELLKLEPLAIDGIIPIRIVEEACTGNGTTDVKELAQFILKNEGRSVHEYLQRLLDRGEPAIKICGYLEDWLTRLAIARAGSCNFEMIRNDVTELKEWKSNNEKDSNGNSRYEIVEDERWGKYARRTGETVSMYSNPKSLWYSCQELSSANRNEDWAYESLYKMGQLQEALRGRGDEVRLMHRFVSSLMRTK